MNQDKVPAAEPTQPAGQEVEVIAEGTPPNGELPAGMMPSRNYMQAVELAHVLAQSGYFTDAREPAKAAVKIMVGMDLGISPTAAMRGIHTFPQGDQVVFVIEGKILAALIRARPGYDYKFVERDETKCTISFLLNGEPQFPDVTYTLDDAQKAGLLGKDNWKAHPREMLTWRALAEGQRIHFPELTGGMPIYASEEFGEDEGTLKDALEPSKPQPLTDDAAEEQRTKAAEVYAEIRELNPERVPPGRFASMVAGAEHSHERLDAVIAALEDLRDTEKEIAALIEQLTGKISADELKALIDRANRRGSNRERIELYTEALEHANGSEGS